MISDIVRAIEAYGNASEAFGEAKERLKHSPHAISHQHSRDLLKPSHDEMMVTYTRLRSMAEKQAVSLPDGVKARIQNVVAGHGDTRAEILIDIEEASEEAQAAIVAGANRY